MIKKLLSAAFFAAVALSATAYEVNDYAYTKVKKFRITGANLVTNGQFNQGATGTDGWTATDGTLPLETTFTMLTGGPNGSNSQQVLAGQTALTNGMYQSIMVNEGGSYIVSLKVMGAAAGFTDLDMTGGNVNYINAYWNTNNVLATVDGTNLYYGENNVNLNDDGTPTNGICGGYGFSFDTNGFTEAVFSIDAPAGGYIIIDFRGLNEGLQIADVCCHKAEEVYDDRIAVDRIAYFNKYLVSEGIAEREFYDDFQASVEEVEAAIERGATPDEMTVIMGNLEGVWAEFVAANFENVIDIIPTTDGSANTGNNSANWMNWKNKWNKLTSEYNGKAPWKWSTDRWCHKTAAENSPMAIDWQRGNANNSWNNIATLTATLSKGKYYWGVTGQGGMKTLNKARWARSWANECAETKLFFNGDTILIDTLNAARNQDYVLEFVLEEDKEVTLGIICNNVSEYDNAGFDVHFYSPVLYKLMDGEYTEADKAYIAAAYTQLEALSGRLAVAYGYCEAANDSLPWGKEALKAGADEAQARFDAWAAMDTTAILAMKENDEVLSDTIMNNGVRFLNNNYITPFEAMNKPFTDMPGAIAAAEETMGMRIYSSSTKMGDLQASIDASKAMYAEKLKVAFSSEDSLALVNQRLAMAALVEEFKVAITAETIIDIDFSNPFNIVVTKDTAGVDVTTYTIAGAKGLMTFTDAAGTAADGTAFTGSSQPYELGYNGTDSLGMLRVGKTEAVVKFEGVPVKSTDIVSVKFDYYFGNYTKRDAGYKILTAEGDTLCGLFYSPYDGHCDRGFNSFGINYSANYLPKVGSGSASNAAIAAASNKTQFEIVFDFGMKKMYCTTTSAKASQTSAMMDIPEGRIPAQFVLYTSYDNSDRRCWFDNLKIQNIAAGEYVDGIESIQVAKPTADGAIYNIMGQKILKPVKGQIYIQNGVKNIAR